jgi:hypothetical protein
LIAAVAGHPLGLDDLTSGEGRGTDVADLALADEVGEGAEGLLDVGVGTRAVNLVEVDPVGVEPPERVLDGPDDPASGAALTVRVIAHSAVELGGQDDVVATASDGLADDLFGFTLGIDVGSVDEIDTGVEGGVDDADRLVVVGVAPGAEHHGAEAQLADGDAGASQQVMVHGCS